MENLGNNQNKQENSTIIEILKEIKDRMFHPLNAKSESLKENIRKQLLTLDDIRDLLDISLSTSYRFIREGILPTRKIGGRYYFYEKDIHDVLEQIRKKDDDEDMEANLIC